VWTFYSQQNEQLAKKSKEKEAKQTRTKNKTKWLQSFSRSDFYSLDVLFISFLFAFFGKGK
jgi:hypothetical protein